MTSVLQAPDTGSQSLSPQISPQMQALLAQMHDIVEPDATLWWPPAPGWWLLAALLLAAIVTITVLTRRHRQRQAYRREALRQIAQLAPLAADLKPQALITRCNELLKRTALAAYPAEHTLIARSHGQAWIDWLHSHCATVKPSTTLKPFDVPSADGSTPGQWLKEGLYRPDVACDPDALVTAVRLWIQHHRLPRAGLRAPSAAGTPSQEATGV